MAELRTVTTGLDFGEGPRWRDGRLWYSDFHRHQIRSVDPTTSEERIELEVPDDRPSGLGWLPDGRLVFVAMVARQLRVLAVDGTVSVHADLADLAAGYCNDMVVLPSGAAVVGNFGFDLERGESPAPTRLIRVAADGSSVESVGTELMFPNGAVVTPDGSTLIVGESFAGRYTAFDLDGDELGPGRVWAEVPGTAPDGCTLDADGGIWFSDALGSQVLRVIEGGEITNTIPTPQPTYACMLGGDDGRDLFILTAPGSHPDEVRGVGGGTIEVVRVDRPRAGLP